MTKELLSPLLMETEELRFQLSSEMRLPQKRRSKRIKKLIRQLRETQKKLDGFFSISSQEKET